MQEYYGEPEQAGDLGLLHASGSQITARVIAHPFESPLVSNQTRTVDRLLSPLAPRDITAIRGLGLQYAPDPTQEASSPPVLCLFFKPATCVSGPGDAIPLPHLAEHEQTDYEVELCVVIGKAGKDIRLEDAMSHVAGCASTTLLKQAHPRNADGAVPEICQLLRGQRRLEPRVVREGRPVGHWQDLRWCAAFSKPRLLLDAFLTHFHPETGWCPIGPCIVSPPVLAKDPHELKISTHVNGKLAQETSTAHLLARLVSPVVPGSLATAGTDRKWPGRSQPEVIARLSHGATLEPGSLILTGSPVAVGRRTPADASSESPFMQDGDEVRCYVEGCGKPVTQYPVGWARQLTASLEQAR